GRYSVEYAPKAASVASDEQHYGRRKLKYLALIASDRTLRQFGSTGTVPPKFVEADGELVRKGGVFAKLRSHERLDLELMAGRGIVTRTTVEIDLKAKRPAPRIDVASIEAQTIALAAEAPYEHVSGVFDMDSAKIGDRTFDQVISRLESLAGERSKVDLAARRNGQVDSTKTPADTERARAWAAGSLQDFVALAAMFRQNPDYIGRAMAHVRGASPAASAIMSGLGAAGTEPAQLALLELMRDDKFVNETLRYEAGYNLLRTKTPTRATALALQGLLHDPSWREHAVLGLGTFVRHFGEAGQTADMTEFGDVLVGELRQSNTTSDRIEVLTGISNSGYVPALAAIKPYLTDANDDVRLAAVQSIRLMQHPDVDALMLAGVRDATSSAVRVGAVEALNNRNYTAALAQALTERLQSETDANARQRVLELLVRWSDKQPALFTAIKQAAVNDKSEMVRASAQQALAARSKG
ncbi:MAG TPA: HEAT repeat domain-containing protein, partial [Polyangiales bacterium]